MKTMKGSENNNISDFILGIGKKIEQVSGAKLNFSEEATVPKEKWIPEEQEKMLLKLGVELRTEKQTQNLEVVELKKFDPCLLNENSEISCCAFKCKKTTSRLPKKCKNKQDLFLCEDHHNDLRLELTDKISKYFAKQGKKYTPNVKNSNDFEGYTSLIGALEKAFMHLKSKWFTTTTDALLAEVFLNTRNFLIITNALLNPNEDNITTALGSYFEILEMILACPRTLTTLFVLLVLVMFLVCQSYNIVYEWLFVPLENPGAKIGFGGGLAFALTFLATRDVHAHTAKNLSFCLLFPFATSFIGSGVWECYAGTTATERSRELRRQFQIQTRPDISKFTGLASTVGRLLLKVERFL